jgi:hypothetical protein
MGRKSRKFSSSGEKNQQTLIFGASVSSPAMARILEVAQE